MKQVYLGFFLGRRYSRFIEYVHDVIDHPQKRYIEKRLEIIKFFDDFGENATKRAFGTSRSTIYLWKQKLKIAGGKTSSLAPGNRAPKIRRRRVVHPFVERFIVEYRELHPGADKVTLMPVLAVACRQAGVKPPSESTIGRIIHDLKEAGRLPKVCRMRIYGTAGRLREIKPRQAARKMRRKGFHPRQPGDLVEMDTISIFVDGLKRYMFTALDVTTRFAFAYAYKSNSSANGRDFLRKFVTVARLPSGIFRPITAANSPSILPNLAGKITCLTFLTTQDTRSQTGTWRDSIGPLRSNSLIGTLIASMNQ